MVSTQHSRNNPLSKKELRQKQPAPTRFIMLEDHPKAFAISKTALANATLHYCTENSKLSHTTDASDTAEGAALHEVTDSTSRPIAFFSRRLTVAERI